MADLQYDREEQFRLELEAVLRRWGYQLDSFALADKDVDRTVTVKAGRNLAATQLRLDEAQG